MFTKQAVITLAAVAAVAATTFANAAGNPLQPNYYAAMSTAPDRATGEVERYVAQNPLTPTYSKAEGKAWLATGSASGTTSFIDARNPLYPQFKRS